MHFARRTLGVCLLGLLAFGLSSCLARRRLISRPPGTTAPTLKVADMTSLAEAVQRQFDAVHDFSATVDMVPALGSAEKNRITEYKDVVAYIRFRKPADIRLIGLLPMIHSKAFDMVSDGTDFKLYLPTRNTFIVGRNEIDKPSPNRWENLRPQHFLDALIVRPIDLKADKIILENFTDEDNAFYILHVVREAANGDLKLNRTIWFGRTDLLLARQIIFDANGNILTDARYSQWHHYDNVPFPKHIEINRPTDEYAVVLDITKMDVNHGVHDDQFVLDQPEGSKLEVVGQPPAKPPAPPRKKGF
jgi:outer membrane lipoprotein-sorting protein